MRDSGHPPRVVRRNAQVRERDASGGLRNARPREIVCPVKMNGALGRVWRGNVKSDSIVLPPNEAAVFEVVAR